jgi:hypothetical protein
VLLSPYEFGGTRYLTSRKGQTMFRKKHTKPTLPDKDAESVPPRRFRRLRRIALAFAGILALAVIGLTIYAWYWSDPMRVAQNDSRGTSVWPIVFLVLVTALVLWLLWKIPVWQVDQSEGLDASNKF